MLRFLMPAVVMVGALVVLLAGALGDPRSLPNLSTEFAALIASVVPNHTETPTLVAPSPRRGANCRRATGASLCANTAAGNR